MIDHGRSKTRQFCRTFTCLRYDPPALTGLRLLSLFLSSVGKISRLYGAKSTLVSTVGRECCMSGSSVSTDMKNHLKCLLYGCCKKLVYQQTLYHKLSTMTYKYLM